MGFWKCWSMTVGVMIGSGVFLLPATLAPYGSVSFLGWGLTSAGAILIALTLGRLAGRTERAGGFYIYGRDAFGGLTGFIMAWGYWIGVVFASTAIAVAFAGYAGALIPALGANGFTQALTAAAIIWLLTIVNIRSVSGAANAQLVTTIMKLLPLAAIIILACFAGSADNIPPFNPKGEPVISAMAATALFTMWAFLGIEAGVIPASDVADPKRTIPRAVVFGTVFVAAVYIAATASVMLLVPAEQLAVSTAPFADAAKSFGAFGGPLIAFGALVATAGALNGNILISGQMPMAVALDGLAPAALAKRNKGHAPYVALIMSSVLSTLLIVFNYGGELIEVFNFLIAMATLGTLAPYGVSAAAELKHSWKNARAWGVLSILAIVYVLFTMVGAGKSTLAWGMLLLAAGVPVFYLGRRRVR